MSTLVSMLLVKANYAYYMPLSTKIFFVKWSIVFIYYNNLTHCRCDYLLLLHGMYIMPGLPIISVFLQRRLALALIYPETRHWDVKKACGGNTYCSYYKGTSSTHYEYDVWCPTHQHWISSIPGRRTLKGHTTPVNLSFIYAKATMALNMARRNCIHCTYMRLHDKTFVRLYLTYNTLD